MAGVLPAAAALALAATGTANAVVSGTYTGTDVNIREAPNTSAPAIGEGQPGQVAYIYCYTTGTSVNGDPYWAYNADHTTGGKGGYSSEEYLSWYAILPHC